MDARSLVASIRTPRQRAGAWVTGTRRFDTSTRQSVLTRAVNDVYEESVAWWSRTDVLIRR